MSILIARLCFRGIYFPQMGKWAWTKVIAQNRQTIYDLAKEALVTWRAARKDRKVTVNADVPSGLTNTFSVNPEASLAAKAGAAGGSADA
jgi:hypothetical protein